MRSKALLFTSAVLCASNVPANALSLNAQLNCANDYSAFCSMHEAGSAELHACMRANRAKLSSSCVTALTDDGLMPKADAARKKVKVAVATAKMKTATRATAKPVTNSIAEAPPASAPAVKPTPEAAPETVSRAPEPPASPPQQAAEAAPAIDQQTFEALKNRAPYFVMTEDLASMFAQADENTSPQSPPR
jgi:hypothetical protein